MVALAFIVEITIPLAAYAFTICCSMVVTRNLRSALEETLRTGPELCKLALTFFFVTLFLPSSEWLESSVVGQSNWMPAILGSLGFGLAVFCLGSYFLFHAIEGRAPETRQTPGAWWWALKAFTCQCIGLASWLATIVVIGWGE